MGFYLNKNMENIYISDSYFKNRLLGNGKDVSVSTMQQNGNFLLKIGVDIPVVSMTELLAPIKKFINVDTMDKYSIILNFNKDHLLAILFLFYMGRITEDQLNDILFSSSAQTRTETLISFFDSQDLDTIDIFAPLKSAVRKMSNKTNILEKEKLSRSPDYVKKSLKSISYSDPIHHTSLGSFAYLVAREKATNGSRYKLLQKIINSDDNIKNTQLGSEATSLLSTSSVPRITSIMNGNANEAAFYWQSVLYIAASNPAAALIYALFGWMGNKIFKRILAAMAGTTMSLNYSLYYDFSFSGMGFKSWWKRNSSFKSYFQQRRYLRFGRLYIKTVLNKAVNYAFNDYSNRLKDTASFAPWFNADNDILNNVSPDFYGTSLSSIKKEDDDVVDGLYKELISKDSDHFSWGEVDGAESKQLFVLKKDTNAEKELNVADITFLNNLIRPLTNSTNTAFKLNNEFLIRFLVNTFEGTAKFASSEAGLLDLMVNFNILINNSGRIMNFGSSNLLTHITNIINVINKQVPVPVSSENGMIGLVDIDSSNQFKLAYGDTMVRLIDNSLDNTLKVSLMSQQDRVKYIFAKYIVRSYITDYVCQDTLPGSQVAISKDNLVELVFDVSKYMMGFYKFLFHMRHIVFNIIEINRIVRSSYYYGLLSSDLFSENTGLLRIYDYLNSFNNSWFLYWWAPNILTIKNDMRNLLTSRYYGSWW